MKKIILVQLSLTFLFHLISTVSLAQKIESTPIPGAGDLVMNTSFEGLIGSKELRSNTRAAFIKYNYNLLVYENNKKLLKKDIQITYNETKYVPTGYFVAEDKIVAYFIAGTKNSEIVKLCLQEFDTELNQMNQPIEITELPRAVDPSKLLNNQSGGMLNDKLVKDQDLNVKYDKKSGTSLFCFSLQLSKEQNLSYCKVILVDNNYNVLNTYEYKATSGENYIQATPQRIFENNDAMVSISEGVKVTERNSLIEKFEISKQAQIYIPANGSVAKELELMPDQTRITNSLVSENLATNGDVLYGIMSVGYNGDKKGTGHIALYKYNVKSKKLNRESYPFELNDVFPDYKLTTLEYFKLKKIYNLNDGSILIWLSGSYDGIETIDYGNIFMKINSDNKVSWLKGFVKSSNSYSFYAGALDFFDEQGNINLIFNYNPKKINGNILEGKVLVDLGSVPVIAKINSSTGEISMKKMSIENNILGGMLISESEKLDDEGRYRMHMMIDKKLQFVDINFNAQ